MSVEQIQKMYDNMYSTKYNDLIKNKNSALADLDKQEAENRETFYSQRNQAAVNNAANRRQTRDWMAKNNLLQSGESVDALLRNNTDYSNSMGSIASNEAKYRNELANSRNKINNEFNGNVAAAKAEIEAQKIKAILDYEQQQAQLAAARRASGSGRSGKSGKSGTYSDSALRKALQAESAYNVRNGDITGMLNTKAGVEEAYRQGLINSKEKEKYLGLLNPSIDHMTRVNTKVNQGTYGYSTANRDNAKSYTPSSSKSSSSKKSGNWFTRLFK